MAIPKSVLVVDDHPGYRDFVVYLLRPMGLHVDTANDVRGAWTRLESASFDVVLLDNIMPEVNGVEALPSLWEKYPAQKVILMSSGIVIPAVFESDDRLIGVLHKPIDLKDFVRTLERGLGHSLPFDPTAGATE